MADINPTDIVQETRIPSQQLNDDDVSTPKPMNDNNINQEIEENEECKEEDTSSPPKKEELTEEIQETIIIGIGDEKKESIQSTQTTQRIDSVTDFVSGLTPFISALEEFNIISPSTDNTTDTATKESKDESLDNNNKKRKMDKRDKRDKADKTDKIEEKVMRPIRELIYKSFHEPSEGEEGIEYVISQLFKLKNLSEGCSTDLVVRSIGHFLSLSLPPSWIDSMCRWMLDRMQLILLKFFTFKHYCSCYFNCDINTSRLFVLQCALHRRFPLLISEGCASLSRSPVFYGTKQCSLFNDNNYIRCSWQLLQTGASFKIIPLHRSSHHHYHHHHHHHHRHKRRTTARNTSTGNEEKADIVHDVDDENIITPLTMDLRTLEQEIERDQSKGRLPCVVISSPTDNLQKIRSICDRHGLWLHIEGGSSSLLLAAATTLPKTTRIMMQCADSISCQPFEWFTISNDEKYGDKKGNNNNNKKGKDNNNSKSKIITKKQYFGDDIPGCTSTLTFIREDLRDTPPPSIQYSDSDFVMMFPLWHLLVTRSIKQIKNRVDHSLNLCQYLNQQLLERKNIFTTCLLSSSLPQIVIFQITPNINVIDLSLFKLDINTFHELLINRCNQEIDNLHIEWKLYDDDDDADNLDIIDDGNEYNRYHFYGSDDDGTGGIGTGGIGAGDSINITPYFRFEPLSYCQPELIINEYISQFIQKIVVEINILRKCLELRRSFQDYIDKDYDLEFVDSSTVQTIMIGLGAFRFIPSFFKNNIESESVHILNKCLCDELNLINKHRTITQIYKLSMDINGIVCIVINPTNMVFEEECIDNIYKQIYQCHKKMKYPQEVMDVMGQAIKNGISNAKKVVADQANSDYSVHSIVRSVPIFGSVYDWLLPDDTNQNQQNNNNLNNHNNDINGIGFQIGVGMTKPQIQRQSKTQNNINNNDINQENADQ